MIATAVAENLGVPVCLAVPPVLSCGPIKKKFEGSPINSKSGPIDFQPPQTEQQQQRTPEETKDRVKAEKSKGARKDVVREMQSGAGEGQPADGLLGTPACMRGPGSRLYTPSSLPFKPPPPSRQRALTPDDPRLISLSMVET